MKKISAILCTLLTIVSCVPQNNSANAGNAVVCLAIGSGLGILGLGVIHPKTGDYWNAYRAPQKVTSFFGVHNNSPLPKEVTSCLDKYYNWRLPLSFTKRPLIKELFTGTGAAAIELNKDTEKAVYTSATLAVTEVLCILIGIHFILKAARV
jgi:hypothetical protein